MPAPLTNSQVDKAGRSLRKYLRGEMVENTALDAAVEILLRFRAAHQYPLGKATMGLRSVVKTERCSRVDVSQRLKRTPTIVDKLEREPTLSLARMQDVGGCGAVLGSIEELRGRTRRTAQSRGISLKTRIIRGAQDSA